MDGVECAPERVVLAEMEPLRNYSIAKWNKKTQNSTRISCRLSEEKLLDVTHTEMTRRLRQHQHQVEGPCVRSLWKFCLLNNIKIVSCNSALPAVLRGTPTFACLSALRSCLKQIFAQKRLRLVDAPMREQINQSEGEFLFHRREKKGFAVERSWRFRSASWIEVSSRKSRSEFHSAKTKHILPVLLNQISRFDGFLDWIESTGTSEEVRLKIR